jgi:2-polyprenyl-3-methyl-5-hydroxy-6-metoxy-1,4-benzoquinol methylase
MNFAEFTKFCHGLSDTIKSQDSDYLKLNIIRFYNSYKQCKKYINENTKMLSIGAGCAYVESALKMECKCDVTVIDFKECIELNKKYYESLQFNFFSLDLNDIANAKIPRAYDVVLCFEIIEHLQVAPSILFNILKRAMNLNGRIIISTPNLGSLSHIRNLLLMRPILPPPEESLAASSYQNEGAHRREYLPVEIRCAMSMNSISVEDERFIFNHNPCNMHELIEYPIQFLISRFKPIILLVGVLKMK